MHQKTLSFICIAQSGSRALSRGEDGRVVRWIISEEDVAGRILGTHKGEVNHICLGLDDRRAVSGAQDGSVRV